MNRHKKELALFNLGKSLVELLGEEQAIADLELLFKRHPEMFKDIKEVSKIIEEVVKEPDLIMKNPKAKNNNDYIVAKKEISVQEKKMADIGIRSDDGTNIIFHANKQNKRNFKRLLNKVADGGAVLSLHTPSQAWMGGNDKSSGVNTLSSTNENILTKSTYQSQAAQGEKAMDMLRQEHEENSNKQNKANKLRNKL